MAHITTSLPADAPPGERRLLELLRDHLRPDDQFSVWVRPMVKEREADFIAFGHPLGILVLEVKDWRAAQIVEASAEQITLQRGDRPVATSHPGRQCRSYVHKLMDHLRRDRRMVDPDGPHRGRLIVPFGWGVVLPNIRRAEWERCPLAASLTPAHVLLADDLDSQSPLRLSDEKLRERLRAMFDVWFPFAAVAEIVRDVLNDSLIATRRAAVEPPPPVVETRIPDIVQALDHSQERVARRLGKGFQIVRGPVGSGKTLVLVYRAMLGRPRRQLFVCYNVALVPFIRAMFHRLGTTPEECGVDLLAFYTLCSKVLQREILQEGQPAEYYRAICRDLMLVNTPLYDSILIDEGQDFDDLMLDALKALLAPGGDLNIAVDPAQDVYHRYTSRRSGAHVMALNKIYRNTAEIYHFAHRFRDPAGTPEEDDPHLLLPEDVNRRGDPPSLVKLKSPEDVLRYIANDALDVRQREGASPLDIAILYPTRTTSGSTRLPREVQEALERVGLETDWIARDFEAKRRFDPERTAIPVSTIHSAKGMDFGTVYLVGIDDLEADERWSATQLISIVYVGLTRARNRLVIPYVRTNPLMRRLQQASRAAAAVLTPG